MDTKPKTLKELADEDFANGSPKLRATVAEMLGGKALSDFTRVVEEMGILDQGRSQKEKSR